ncbi:TVP38/TMEM64 family protein [Leptolyngbya ohadii]|uniref:TVP38/TMEM64 family protein n=1 Tax=Leptolyngbya ohadii TaxID=1962290 RepID=UPI000B59D7AA|nr:TVP38/TMEM64 family protein [Leptolyngbya ohadii]
MILAAVPLQEMAQHLLETLQQGKLGAVQFVLVYSLATVAFVPGSLLTLGAGAVFGLLWGSVWVFLGATIGATLAFLIGRYGVRGWVSRKIANYPRFQAIDRAVSQSGLKIVLLARLSPVIPFNLLNYGLGITGVSLKDYVLGSVGMIPGTVLYVYLGSIAGSLANLGTVQPENARLQWTVRIIGLLATIAVTFIISRIARQAIEGVTEAEAIEGE